ncbi:MAG: ribulose-phosphate 3-epimerase [Lachnospiraceae bacterium]|nr:ribulose-phosphate 3-epimerase [Lachnospiraceae bacterium]
MLKLAPSILAADFARLGDEVATIDRAGADMVHIDVMDGVFVPNISIGIPVVQSLRKASSMVFDVHLMIQDPAKYIQAFAEAGADSITVHAEASGDLGEHIGMIRRAGKKVGICISPDTPVSALDGYIEKADMILLMGVQPGFGGQHYMPHVSDKIRELRGICDKIHPSCDIEVDGGITLDNVEDILDAGANVIVAGSSVFKGDVTAHVKAYKEIFAKYGR